MRRGCGEQLLSLDLPRELPAGPLFVEQLSTGMVESANNPVTHVRRIGEATRRFLWITSFLQLVSSGFCLEIRGVKGENSSDSYPVTTIR